MKSYCGVNFPRAGLGNRLIPWARAEVFADLHNLDMVGPKWVQLKVGPLLRGEADLRHYAGQFRQRSGTRPRWTTLWPPRQKVFDPQLQASVQQQGVAYIFGDHKMLFADLVGHRSLVAKRLAEVTRDSVKARVAAIESGLLAAHIRLGDFIAIPGMASSIDWYAKTIHVLLNRFPRLAPALVFSDATDREIAPVLSHPKVKRVTTGSALGDILALSCARALVASGNSSFSAWASYLSESPTFYEPGHDLRGFFNFDPRIDWLWEASMDRESDYLDAVARYFT